MVCVKYYILVLLQWIICFKTAESIYFIHSNLNLSIHSWKTDRYAHVVRALLEPDESGQIFYNRINNQTRQSCPKLSINKNGLVWIEPSPLLTIEKDKKCDYLLEAKLVGAVGSRNRSKANLNLTVMLVKGLDVQRKECDFEAFCFGGLLTFNLQVMENSNRTIVATLGNSVDSCSKEKANYSVSVTSVADKDLLLVEGTKDFSSPFSLWIRSDLDRETIPAYYFNVLCSVTTENGSVAEVTLRGSLSVLDQDDCPPYPRTSIGQSSETVVNISLISLKNSFKGESRLEPDNGWDALSFFDDDSGEVNNFRIDTVNDTKEILKIQFSSQHEVALNKPANWTIGVLSAELKVKSLPPWDGCYSVLVIVNDITLAIGRGDSKVRFSICLYFRSEQEPTTKRLREPAKPHFGFIIAIVCTALMGVLLLVCMMYRYKGKRKSRAVDTPVLINANGVLVAAGYGDHSGNGNVISTDMDYIGPGNDIHALSSLTEYLLDSKWEVPRSTLILQDVIGEGEFGRVLRAKFKPVDPQGRVMDVAVKMLKDNEVASGKSCRQEFMAEFSLLKQVNHHNVIKLVGVCTIEPGPPYLIMEYAEFKSLRSFLRKCRRIESIPNTSSSLGIDTTAFSASRILLDANTDSHYVVTPKEILGFSWQIAKGMAYLSEMKMVHRDLAARNILLTLGKVCKISDFGLTRDVYMDDAYKKKSKDRVPVKWLAPECLADELYTTKSDVWAYGILLWELVNMGASPYPGIPSEQLYSLLKAGYRMPLPSNCTAQLYALMLQCWENEASSRPTFRHLVASLGVMLEDGIEYLQLDIPSVSNPGYDFHTADSVPISFNAASLPQSSSHAFSRDTESSKGQLSDAPMEKLRLIDHEIPTCDEPLKESTQYNNTYVHTYINNERHKEESENSDGLSRHETISIPVATSAYESPIKIKSVSLSIH